MKLSPIRHFQHSIFALVKVLTVASIVVILSVIILINYTLGGFQLSFEESAYKLAQDIRRAEEMAMLVEEFEGSVPPGGYGMNFDLSNPDRCVLFADNGNRIYDPDDTVIEEIELEGGARISELYEGKERVAGALPLDIVFTPPNPIVNINSGKDSGTIILWNEETNETAAIYINLAGLIEVQ